MIFYIRFFLEPSNPIGFLQPKYYLKRGFRGRRILRPTDMIQNLMHLLQGLVMYAWKHCMTHEFFHLCTHEDVSKTRFAKGQRNWFGFWNNYIIVIIMIIIIIILVEFHM